LCASGPRKYASESSLFHTITTDCISCDACTAECPANAISSGPEIYVISQERCLDCGACETICPTEAITSRVRQDHIADAWARQFMDPEMGL
jgi:Fe-S-cluster-containing hydrogenase component 2